MHSGQERLTGLDGVADCCQCCPCVPDAVVAMSAVCVHGFSPQFCTLWYCCQPVPRCLPLSAQNSSLLQVFSSLVSLSFSVTDGTHGSPTSSCLRSLWRLLTSVKCGRLSQLSLAVRRTINLYLLSYLHRDWSVDEWRLLGVVLVSEFLGEAVLTMDELSRLPSNRQIIPLTSGRSDGGSTTSGSVTVEVRPQNFTFGPYVDS